MKKPTIFYRNACHLYDSFCSYMPFGYKTLTFSQTPNGKIAELRVIVQRRSWCQYFSEHETTTWFCATVDRIAQMIANDASEQLRESIAIERAEQNQARNDV